MRLCPTVDGSASPLITHRIGTEVCLARQSTFFHKCHRCQYRGKAADWEPEPVPTVEITLAPLANGVPHAPAEAATLAEAPVAAAVATPAPAAPGAAAAAPTMAAVPSQKRGKAAKGGSLAGSAAAAAG